MAYRRPKTAAEREKAATVRQEKLEALHQTLAAEVSKLTTGEQWRRWLEVAGQFHNYSFGNVLLIATQRENATQVGGYNLWQQLGRQVNKGEKGIAILAPVTRRTDPAAEDTDPAAEPAGEQSTAKTTRQVVGWRAAYVWDISQTSGDPLPERPRPQLLQGQAPAGLWEALALQVEAAGFTVSRQPTEGTANGYTDFLTREVVVRPDLDDAQAVKTLAHELGHALLHDTQAFDGQKTTTCRGSQEVEAESVAYLVAAENGLDTAEYTFAYVAGWAAQTGDVEAAIQASGQRVMSAAHKILDSLDAPSEVEPAAQSVLADELPARVAAGQLRTAELREAAERPEVGRDRLAAANAAAVDYFTAQYAQSWAPTYLHARLGGGDQLDELAAARNVGYAPAGWTGLVDQLRASGFDDREIIAAGLGKTARNGNLIDTFRDRVVFPILSDTQGEQVVVGFTARRNPDLDADPPAWAPKYLNTPSTSLFVKGEHLYGIVESRDTVRRDGPAVVVEGPLDALAVHLSSDGRIAGIGTLGTAITSTHAARIANLVGGEPDRVVIATDADAAGYKAAATGYFALTARQLDPLGAVLPTGLDPAQLRQTYGPAALVHAIASAEPLARQVALREIDGLNLDWPEHRVGALERAGRVLAAAPPETWEREADAVANTTGLDAGQLRSAIVTAIPESDDALGRLSSRDRRDDLDRGQLVPATAAEIAALSTRPRPMTPAPRDTTAQESVHRETTRASSLSR